MNRLPPILLAWFAAIEVMMAGELWIADPSGLDAGEKALLASLQGVMNRTGAVVWVKSGGMNARILSGLREEGWTLHEGESLTDLIRRFRPALSGMVVCDVTNESLNVATSLAALTNAVVADAALAARLSDIGLPVVADARGVTTAEIWSRHGHEFTRSTAVHQSPSKPLHLRDLAVSLGLWTFSEVSPEDRTRFVRELGPNTRVLGWGGDEHDFVRDVSAGGGAVLPADWSLNLSALRHLRAKFPVRPKRPEPEPLKPGERVVAFVVSDGDNLQWIGGGFVDSPGFWASTNRGAFPVTWETAPSLAEFAPRALAYFLRTATTNDDFVCGPSGYGYQFPSLLPDRKGAAVETARWAGRTGFELVSVLNSGGGMEQMADWLEQPAVTGLLYKDYSPYNRRRGAVWWHAGKPCISYRFLLWESKRHDGTLRPDWLPEGVAEAVAAMPSARDAGEGGFALVNVHAWSFRDSGGPMGAIHRTVRILPADTRVVTTTDFFRLLTRHGKP